MDPNIQLSRQRHQVAFNRALDIAEAEQLQSVRDSDSTAVSRITEIGEDKALTARFALRSFMGFDLLMSYLDDSKMLTMFTWDSILEMLDEHVLDVNEYAVDRRLGTSEYPLPERTRVKSDSLDPKLLEKLKPLAESHYLSKVADKDDILSYLVKIRKGVTELFKNNHALKKEILDEQVEMNEYVEEFLQDMFEEKIVRSKASWRYTPSVEQVMGPFMISLFNIYQIMAFDPNFNKHECELMYPKHYKSNWACSTVIDLLIYEHLLNDGFPLGYIKFLLMPIAVTGSRIKIKLSFFEKDNAFLEYKIIFDIDKRAIYIQNSKRQKDKVKVKVNRNGLSEISGRLNGRDVFLKINRKKLTFDERLNIHPWKSGRVLNHHHIEEGSFSNVVSSRTKNLDSHYQVSKHGNQHFVFKKVDIGEDQYACTYIFRDDIPIPIGGSGFIKNKEPYDGIRF